MTDEQKTWSQVAPDETAPQPADSEPTDVPAPEPTQPVDTPLEKSPAHPVDEDPEQHMGDPIADPWDDESQTDWPNGSVDYPGVSS